MSANKSREPRGSAVKHLHPAIGMVLAEAFVRARSNGSRLVVNKLDGVCLRSYKPEPDERRLNVDVVNGIVQRAWYG